jgi:hypothetical protein
VLESMMIWQLLQVRHPHDTPLIFAGPMWKGLVDWASALMLRPGFELAIPRTSGYRAAWTMPRRRWPSSAIITHAG